MSPTQRSLKLLRDAGYTADKVEQWIPGAKIRRDAFGFGDILAYNPDGAITVLVQATTAENISHRKNKVLRDAEMLERLTGWLRCNNGFLIHGWVKRGRFWQCKEIQTLYNPTTGDLFFDEAPSLAA